MYGVLELVLYIRVHALCLYQYVQYLCLYCACAVPVRPVMQLASAGTG